VPAVLQLDFPALLLGEELKLEVVARARVDAAQVMKEVGRVRLGEVSVDRLFDCGLKGLEIRRFDSGRGQSLRQRSQRARPSAPKSAAVPRIVASSSNG